VPHERVQFALVRPSCLVRGQSRPNRIPKDVFPFLGVAFAASELAVPAVALPDFAILRMRPAGCGQRLPVRSPFLDRWVWRSPRSAENVNVIGHDDITSDHPTVGLAPGGLQKIADPWAARMGLRSCVHTVTSTMIERFPSCSTGGCAGCDRRGYGGCGVPGSVRAGVADRGGRHGGRPSRLPELTPGMAPTYRIVTWTRLSMMPSAMA